MEDWLDTQTKIVIGVIVVVVVALILWGSGLSRALSPTPTPTPTPKPTPTPDTTPTTFSDLLVWRFCSSVIQGTVEEAQLSVIQRMDESGLSNDKEQAMRVLALVREYGTGGRINANLVAETYEACMDWRRHDSETAR